MCAPPLTHKNSPLHWLIKSSIIGITSTDISYEYLLISGNKGIPQIVFVNIKIRKNEIIVFPICILFLRNKCSLTSSLVFLAILGKLGYSLKNFLKKKLLLLILLCSCVSSLHLIILRENFTYIIDITSKLASIQWRLQRCIENPVKHLRWSVLRKQLKPFSRELFPQNPST